MKKLNSFFPALIALLLSLPGLFFLAHFPQSPDGAELYSTAVAGGVLHPSGLPLQAWLDRLFILIFPATPALGLSLLSWIAEWAAITLLLHSLRKLGVQWFAALAAAIAYAFYSQMATLSVQPEKYSLIAMLSLGLVYVVISALKRTGGPTPRDLYFTAFAFALALAQHTSLALLLPIAALPFFLSQQARTPRVFSTLLAFVIFSFAVATLYGSLLWLRASRPWPDWGNLQTLGDLWHHVIRSDFKNGLINLDEKGDAPKVRALIFLLKGLEQWTALIACLPIGLFALWRRRPSIAYMLGTTVLLMLLGLWWTELPMPNEPITLGYGSRYPCVVLPLLALLVGCGLDWLFAQGRIFATATQVLASAALVYVVFQGFSLLQKTDSNVIEIYRNEVARELPPDAIFVSTNEIDLFYGIPCAKGSCFPIKNLFASEWYRERTAPEMDPRITDLLKPFYGKPWDYTKLLIAAVQKGYTLASTSGNLFIQVPEFRGHIEQKGLVWTVSPALSPLYTKSIFFLENAENLCNAIKTVKFPIPKDGDYFLHEILQNFHYVYLSAADFIHQRAICEPLEAIF